MTWLPAAVPTAGERLARLIFAAVNAGDLDGFLDGWTEDAEFRSAFSQAEGGEPYRGHDGLRAWWENRLAAWEDYRIEHFQSVQIGRQLLLAYRIEASGRESGAALSTPVATVMTLRDGKIAQGTTHTDPVAALHDMSTRVRGDLVA